METIIEKEDKEETTDKVEYEQFEKIDLRVGEVLDVQDHPKADKLYILTVDLGEKKPRTIVAGLKKYYQKEQLKGKKAIFVANLAPATLRGIESNGMILAAVDGGEKDVMILQPERDIEIGSKVR